jgi:thiol-disulfide isomerase/thioredoxin
MTAMHDYLPASQRSHWLLLLLVALCMAPLSGCKKDQVWKTGTPTPEISVLDLENRTAKLVDYKGKVVVLRFWATGCKACVEGMPKLDTYRKRYADKDLAVLAINIGGSREMVEAFAKGLKLTYPVLLDPQSIASKKYEVRSVPTIFFIDRKGIARKRVIGELTEEQFHATIRELL